MLSIKNREKLYYSNKKLNSAGSVLNLFSYDKFNFCRWLPVTHDTRFQNVRDVVDLLDFHKFPLEKICYL